MRTTVIFVLVLSALAVSGGCARQATRQPLVLASVTSEESQSGLDLPALTSMLTDFREVPKADFYYLSPPFRTFPTVEGAGTLVTGQKISWTFHSCAGLHVQLADGSERFFLPPPTLPSPTPAAPTSGTPKKT
jgi:hypothetical protein